MVLVRLNVRTDLVPREFRQLLKHLTQLQLILLGEKKRGVHHIVHDCLYLQLLSPNVKTSLPQMAKMKLLVASLLQQRRK